MTSESGPQLAAPELYTALYAVHYLNNLLLQGGVQPCLQGRKLMSFIFTVKKGVKELSLLLKLAVQESEQRPITSQSWKHSIFMSV